MDFISQESLLGINAESYTSTLRAQEYQLMITSTTKNQLLITLKWIT